MTYDFALEIALVEAYCRAGRGAAGIAAATRVTVRGKNCVREKLVALGVHRTAGRPADWTTADVPRFTQLWAAGTPVPEIARAFGRSIPSVDYQRRALGLPPRCRSGVGGRLTGGQRARVNELVDTAIAEASSALGRSAGAIVNQSVNVLMALRRRERVRAGARCRVKQWGQAEFDLVQARLDVVVRRVAVMFGRSRPSAITDVMRSMFGNPARRRFRSADLGGMDAHRAAHRGRAA